jgi:hypothetical protein
MMEDLGVEDSGLQTDDSWHGRSRALPKLVDETEV